MELLLKDFILHSQISLHYNLVLHVLTLRRHFLRFFALCQTSREWMYCGKLQPVKWCSQLYIGEAKHSFNI